MMTFLSKIKQFFSKEKSPEALEMWETLKDDYNGDPEFHPSLDLDAGYALSLNNEDRARYLNDLVRRRNEAHDKYLDQRIKNEFD